MTSTIRTLMMLLISIATAAPSAAQERFPDGTEISLLQWSHFVPTYDEWFDNYTRDWGAANNVSVTVDHVNFTELPTSLAAEIDAGQGHTDAESDPRSLDPDEPSWRLRMLWDRLAVHSPQLGALGGLAGVLTFLLTLLLAFLAIGC